MTTPKGTTRKYAPPRRSTISTQRGQPAISQVVGVRGLKNLGGRIQEEYDRLLQGWSDAIDFYIEMRDDITISTLMQAIKLPLLAAEFDVEAASDSLADTAARDWLWDAMNNMDRQTWRSHVSDMLEAPEFGWALAEIVLEKRKDGRLWIKNLDPRGQETLRKWEFDEFDHVTAFVQTDPDTGKQATIPIDKTIHMTHGGRKGNPIGRGMYRTLFRTWRFLKNVENLEGIGLERNIGGMPIAKLPPEPLSDTDISDLKTALANLRMDEEMYLITPNGLEISAYSGSINTAPLNLVIDRKQKEILQLGFAQFIKLGMNQVGTQALVKGSQDFFALGLEAIQQNMIDTWNGQLIPLLFRFNQFSFPGMTGFPKIVWHQPGKVDIESLLNAYNTALQAKVMTPLREDEEFFRGEMDLSDLPDGVGEEVRPIEEPAEPAGGGFPFSHFAEEDPDKRQGSGDYERVTNRLQSRMLNIYDQWAIDTRTSILAAQDRGIPADQFSRIIQGRLSELENNLIEAQSAGITTAVAAALTLSLRSNTRVAGAITALQANASQAIRANLISSIRDRLTNKLSQADSTFDRSNLKEIFDSARFSVAATAGLGWSAIFTALVAAGREQERESGVSQRVRWVLNDNAEHCSDSPGHFGCPGLAGVYDSWSELETVPAGDLVTCRGNCRCHLEVETEPGSNNWVRGLPGFSP